MTSTALVLPISVQFILKVMAHSKRELPIILISLCTINLAIAEDTYFAHSIAHTTLYLNGYLGMGNPTFKKEHPLKFSGILPPL